MPELPRLYYWQGLVDIFRLYWVSVITQLELRENVEVQGVSLEETAIIKRKLGCQHNRQTALTF